MITESTAPASTSTSAVTATAPLPSPTSPSLLWHIRFKRKRSTFIQPTPAHSTLRSLIASFYRLHLNPLARSDAVLASHGACVGVSACPVPPGVEGVRVYTCATTSSTSTSYKYQVCDADVMDKQLKDIEAISDGCILAFCLQLADGKWEAVDVHIPEPVV